MTKNSYLTITLVCLLDIFRANVLQEKRTLSLMVKLLYFFTNIIFFCICRKHCPVLSSFMTYHRVCNQINTTGVTSGTGTVYPPRHLSSPPVFSGVRVTQSLVLCVCFVDRCLSFYTFSFGHCVVCSSSIYGF